MVTNPKTRDWSVTASLFATLNEMFGNRTICAIGRGDSSLRVIGQEPASLASLAEAAEAIQDLAEGRETNLRGTRVQLPWVRNGRLPVWIAGIGPRALDLIGRKADGFVLGVADNDVVRWAVSRVRRAASLAGRNPADVTVCLTAPAYIGADLAHQRSELRWYGGMVGNHVAELVARYGKEGELPNALIDYVEGRTEYDYKYHGRRDNPLVDFVADDVVSRFCLLGTAEQHIERLSILRDLGVDHFALQLMHDAKEETVRQYGTTVIPAIRGGSSNA
jgi:probable F420-dependent oxidoreductase